MDARESGLPRQREIVVHVPDSNPSKSAASRDLSGSEVIPGLPEVTFHLVKMLEVKVIADSLTEKDLLKMYAKFDLQGLLAKIEGVAARMEEIQACQNADFVALTQSGFRFDLSQGLLSHLSAFISQIHEKKCQKSAEIAREMPRKTPHPRFWRIGREIHGDLTVDQALYKTHLCENMVRINGFIVEDCPKGVLCLDAHCECEQITKDFHDDSVCAQIMALENEKAYHAGNSDFHSYRLSDEQFAEILAESRTGKSKIKTARASNQDNSFKTLLCKFHHESAHTGIPCPNQTKDFSTLDLNSIMEAKKSGAAKVCLYAHGPRELRFRPEDFKNILNLDFKREPCQNLLKNNFCPHGKKCHFAHCSDELFLGRCTEIDLINDSCKNAYRPLAVEE